MLPLGPGLAISGTSAAPKTSCASARARVKACAARGCFGCFEAKMHRKTWLGKIGKNWGNLQTQRLLQDLFPYPMVIFHMWKRRWLHGSIPRPWPWSLCISALFDTLLQLPQDGNFRREPHSNRWSLQLGVSENVVYP